MEMTRRQMFAAASAAAAMTFPHTALGGWEPSERYPDPAIKSLDPSFNRYRLFNASIERLATGMRWCEGPVYFGDARCVIWSDIPNNRLMRYDEVRARSASIANPPTTPTAIAVTARGALSPASTRRGGSRAPNTMARSRC